MCVPTFFVDQWTEYNLGHSQISGFRRKPLIMLNVFYLILLFLRRFLIFFMFFFYLYPYLFFLKLWFIFFCLTVFIQDFWRPKNGQCFRRKQLILLNVFDLLLLFLRRFLIYSIFFFYFYPYIFLKLWFTFFYGLNVFIQDFWRPKNGHSFSLHISLDFCFLSILHLTVFL